LPKIKFVSFEEHQDIHSSVPVAELISKVQGDTVSQAAAELQQYCMQNACKDALLVGVPAGSNPFREPRSCALL
ncbi:PREDICTED: guanine nucleotide-binding protein G(I)/G(S)/G(O) subunit gamma-10-like, partial [Leptosomus discolor]|uniref:guanine nucleotide-binding protein G(I)/G(S)/G(O) subunit gamma-10-like n=1 Tax=Leptosomus discolor TaxID=188344 RepID=UPI000522D344